MAATEIKDANLSSVKPSGGAKGQCVECKNLPCVCRCEKCGKGGSVLNECRGACGQALCSACLPTYRAFCFVCSRLSEMDGLMSKADAANHAKLSKGCESAKCAQTTKVSTGLFFRCNIGEMMCGQGVCRSCWSEPKRCCLACAEFLAGASTPVFVSGLDEAKARPDSTQSTDKT